MTACGSDLTVRAPNNSVLCTSCDLPVSACGQPRALKVCATRCFMNGIYAGCDNMCITMHPILETIRLGVLGLMNATCAPALTPCGGPLGACELARMSTGDTLVWVGRMQAAAVPWRALGARGVRRVFYEADPMPPIEHARRGGPAEVALKSTVGFAVDVDEIWHYTHANTAVFQALYPHVSHTHRYVPPGKHGWTGGNSDSTKLKHGGGVNTMMFVGDVSKRNPSRLECWRALNSSLYQDAPRGLGQPLRALEHIVALDSLVHLDRRIANGGLVHINFHKSCTARHADQLPLESVRLSKLLSLGRFVISQRSDTDDEAEFDGIVTFVGPRGREPLTLTPPAPPPVTLAQDPEWLRALDSAQNITEATWRKGLKIWGLVGAPVVVHSLTELRNLSSSAAELAEDEESMRRSRQAATTFAAAVEREASVLAGLATSNRSELTRSRRRRLVAFATKFAPEAILRRAGVPEALCHRHTG